MALQSALVRATYKIIGGPSKMELMLGLFDSTRAFSRPVSFTVETKPMAGPTLAGSKGDENFLQRSMQISITSVGKEDGSGESWNVEGMVKPLDHTKGDYARVRIYFSTHRRNGILSFMHS